MTSALFPEAPRASATITVCGRYRYDLTRRWDFMAPFPVVFIMLNPSTADHDKDDPTIRKCIGFAKRWGFGGFTVVNLFAWRATNPRELRKVSSPIGPENTAHILQAVRGASRVIAAWGTNSFARRRGEEVERRVADEGRVLECLGRTKDGSPKHPLYVPYETAIEILHVRREEQLADVGGPRI